MTRKRGQPNQLLACIAAAAIGCRLSGGPAHGHSQCLRDAWPSVPSGRSGLSGHLHDPGTAAEDPHHGPVPGHLSHRLLNPAAVHRSAARWPRRMRGADGTGPVLGFVSMFSGGNLSQRTHLRPGHHALHLGLDYLPAPGSVYPPLEKLQKEGESGRKKINEYTRYATVVICLFQAWFWCAVHHAAAAAEGSGWAWPSRATTPASTGSSTSIVTMTAGTIFLMWLGEQIDEYGIGNGISLIIMAGIVARIPDATAALLFERRPFQGVGLHAGRRRHGGDIELRETGRADRAVRRRGRRRSSPSPRASGASRRSRPSTSAAGASSAAPGSSCRCRSTRPASCR